MFNMDYPRFKDINIDKSFQKLKNDMFINYRGALIMRDKNPKTQEEGYYWKDQWFNDIGAAKLYVDTAINELSKSINISMVITKDGKDIPVDNEHVQKYFTGSSPYESYTNSKP